MRTCISAFSFGAVLLALASTAYSQTNTEIGREVAIPRHLQDGEEFDLSPHDLIRYGKNLFEAHFTRDEGAGRPLTKGTGAPLTDPNSPLIFPRNNNRVSGPESNSCSGCHNQPIAGGAGDLSSNVFVLGQRFDFATFDPNDIVPTRGAVDERGRSVTLQSVANSRATPGMFGSGYYEMLARQITGDLQSIRDRLRPGQRTHLTSKGISFGVLARNTDGSWNTSAVEGLSPESTASPDAQHPPSLLILPFSQAGATVSLRVFTVNAFNQHHGMQATERFGIGTDPDGDGIVNELTRADITASTIFQATLPVPSRSISSDPVLRRAARDGERLFQQIGCAGCHIPALQLDRHGWIYTEPNPYNPPGNMQIGEAPTLSVDLASDELPQPRLKPINGVIMVPLYTDFKLHDICSGPNDPNRELLNQNAEAGSTEFFAGNTRFLTKRLWAVGSKPNYFHHGQFTTIREAILNHFGEALSTQQAFSALSLYEQGSGHRVFENTGCHQRQHPLGEWNMYIRRTAFWILVLAIAIPGWNRVSASAKFGPRANTGAAKAFAGQTEEEATGPEGSVPIEPPVRKRKPLALQQLIGASWRTDHTFQSSIQITNQLSIADLDVTPVLYMADGAEYPLPSVHVPRLAVETVSINDAVAAAPLEILPHLSSYGSAVLRYTWHWDAAVSGSILNLDVPRSLTFTSRFVGPGKMTSHPQRQVIEGLWWVPFPRSGGFVSLMNTTSRPLDAVVEAFGPRGERVRVVNQHIGPNSTSMLPLRELIDDRWDSPRFGGIRVSYEGEDKALTVTGGVEDATKGYSAAIPFLRPMQAMMSSTSAAMASAGMMAGPQDPMMAFPKDTVFRPYALVRNISSKPVKVNPSISYQFNGSVKSIALPAVQFEANQTAPMLSPEIFSRKDLKRSGGFINLLLVSDAPAGSLVTATGSVDQTGTYVFEVEPQAVSTTETMQLPYWNTAEGNDTMINLWNTSSQQEDAVLVFFYPGGRYRHPVHLGANGSAMISVKELQTMGAPDEAGNLLPQTITTGSAWLSSAHGTAAPLNVVSSVGTFNVLTATCGTKCPNCLAYQNFWVSPDPLGFGYGTNGHFDSYAQNTSGGTSPVTSQSTWSSSNSGVGRLVSAGTFYGVSPGSFQGTAQANLLSGSADCAGTGSPCPSDFWQDQSPGNVVSLSCSPSSLAWGSSVTCTVSGASAGQVTQWTFSAPGIAVNGPAGSLTWSGQMVVSGTVTATAVGVSRMQSIAVNSRSTFPLVQMPTPQLVGNGGSATGVTLPTLTSPPTTAEGSFGYSGYGYQFNSPTAAVQSGPNAGVYYVSSFTYTTAYIWELSPALTNPSDPFYQHQGNCFPTISQIVSAVQTHEIGVPGPSHYTEVQAALASNNPATEANNYVGSASNASGDIDAIFRAAVNAGAAEPPTNLPANINYPPYRSCP